MRPILLLALVGCATADAPLDGPSSGDPAAPDAPIDTVDPIDDAPREGRTVASSTVQRARLGDRWLVLDGDLGAIDVLSADGAPAQVVPVGAEPTRLVAHGGAWFVTLRASGEVVKVAETADGLAVVARAAVGVEPYDVVGSAHRDAVYVSLSQEGAVVELDPATLAERARWRVGGEPRWLATSPADAPERVAMAFAGDDRAAELDRAAGDALVERPLPVVPRFTDPGCRPRDLVARASGGVAYGADGTLLVAALYADTQLAPVDHVSWRQEHGESGFCEQDGERAPECPTYYGCTRPPPKGDVPSVVGLFDPAVVAFPPGGEPRATLAVGSRAEGFLPSPAEDVRGAPSALSVDGAGRVWVALEGADAVTVVDLPTRDVGLGGGFASRRVFTVAVPGGPVGLAADPTSGATAVWGALDRRLALVRDASLDAVAARDLARGGVTAFLPVDVVARELAAPASTLPDDLRRGRWLFTTAQEASMGAPGSGVSCATCHPEGRADGFTWRFVDFPRSTPSLAGGVEGTLPLGWLGEVPDAATDVLVTTASRMGGVGLTEVDAARVAGFLEHLRPIARPPGVDPVVVEAGEAAFEASCASCHPGEAGTDGQRHDVPGGLRLDTPGLRGVAVTGPWLHDGSADRLVDVVRTAHAAGMTPLDAAVTDDVVAYLLTR